ncbi:uncharacterized protein E0L32_005132 [Thyridium curvatum]|uniref:Photolyase/cryptochrome alpha/beta domain-containing protein n=1 Tax=Thyridium curvatum TaxID=1093900 RepID=A0A507B4R5_9PEZI|nr:uncharacterized protein E0L32_005132 [Thyridium curvatum]TPX14737.1 hypothetical protein E0L32_005132 [Thyridium curvatum]
MAPKHERTKSSDDMLRHPSPKKAKEIDQHTPYEALLDHMDKQNADQEPRTILHWFRSKELRAEDNRALMAASRKSKEASAPLVTCFLFSPKDMEWHGTSPVRVDFTLETLRLLQSQLKEMNIPLAILTAESRGDKGPVMLNFLKKHNISHMFANLEYEVDEMRRDISLFERLESDGMDTAFHLFHDQSVVEPGTMKGGAGTPQKVFTPYYKHWLDKVAKEPELLDTEGLPEANDKEVTTKFKDLFDSSIPSLPKSKPFASEEERKRLRKLWPAGHAAAKKRLDDFLKNKASTYKTNRSTPAADNSSRLSPYFSAGVLSVREALSAASEADGRAPGTFDGDAGIASWVREIVFREFYRQRLVGTPHDSMNLPHNLKFDYVRWEDDGEGWRRWCEGATGVPFVDAGMRQLRHEGWMHNRLRMNTASYLRTNLLIDYRRGERFFAETLVDWDLSNNHQGWEPSYTVFNPVVQAEKCDPDGDYIRKWVPELKDVEGKAVFDPYHRLDKKEFEKLGYPKPHVDFKESRQRCIERYKQDMAEADI